MSAKKEIPRSHDSQPYKVDYKKNESTTNFANERALFKSTLKSSFSISKFQEALLKNVSFPITYYEFGQAEKTDANVKKMRQLKPAILVGSVDSTRFAQKWHEAKWYKPYIDAAAQLSKCEKLLDPATKKWLKEVRPALDVFLKLGTYSGNDRILKRKYHKDIWELVKKNGSDMVYGKKGVLNFLLAFRRITNVQPQIDDLSVEQIKLMLGEGVGKKKGAMDRFAHMVVKKGEKVQKKTNVQPKVAPKTKPKVAPKTKPKTKKAKPKPKVVPKVKPAVKPAEKALQFGSAKFFKKYEIKDPAVFIKDLDLFKGWIVDEKMKYLQDKAFWDKKAGETDAQADARFGRLFSSKRAGIRKLYVDLSGLEVYEKWFAEADDDVSRKYKLLYFWVVKRMAEYMQKYEADPMAQKEALLHYHNKIMLTESLLKGKRDTAVLMQLIDSSEYLMNNDDDPKGMAKWKKLNIRYKKDFLK